MDYRIREEENLFTPALLFYEDTIKKNTEETIRIARDPGRLWPHVKSHKTKEMIYMQMEMGITRFKVSTLTEMEMAAQCKAACVLLAYPLVGPNQKRYLEIGKKYPETKFFCIGDSREQLLRIGKLAEDCGMCVNVLIDVNTGQNRSGVDMNALSSFEADLREIRGILICGFHCYDGHIHDRDLEERQKKVDSYRSIVEREKKIILESGGNCSIMVMGGTPTFPCHASYEEGFLSPGTSFLWDAGYQKNYPDLKFTAAAVVAARVVSSNEQGYFTFDLGYKAIASDAPRERGIVVGLKHAKELYQNEEHWVFRMDEGYESLTPKVGSLWYVIPWHVCPTSILYKEALIVKNGSIYKSWEIAGRDRTGQCIISR